MSRAVLVVEDDRDVQDSMQMVLELGGNAVLTASNGREALEVLRTRAPEIGLILLDVLMPVMDGWSFLRARDDLDPEARAIPVVVVSAADPGHPLASRVAAFLAKPVDVDRLLDVVRTHLCA